MTLDNEGDLKFDMHAQENQGFYISRIQRMEDLRRFYNRYSNFTVLCMRIVFLESQGIEVKTDIFQVMLQKKTLFLRLLKR